MKLKMFYQIVIFQLYFLVNVSAQLPRTVEEIKKMTFNSNLTQIAESEGAKENNLEVQVIKKILTNHENALVGDITEVSKFATLQDLCLRIEALKEREQLENELFSLFKKLNVVEGEPKNWNEHLVKSEGGSLGLVSKCLLASLGKDMQLKVLDYLIEEDQFAKAEVFFKKADIAGKREELVNLLAHKIDAAKSEKMKTLFRDFVENKPWE